jgi:hypothetical protein
MAKPKLTREECDDIRRMYSDRTRKESSGTLARLFRVSPAVILKVVDNTYTPLEDYEERRGAAPIRGGIKNDRVQADEAYGHRRRDN